ncbi:MAG: hypothetical protein ACR65T_17775 [Methylocystis sp.]|uniref:hypothetical protein n=1 Tax=Methylocystis sp. TaxID=1911079 RepID=UPI003DA611A2
MKIKIADAVTLFGRIEGIVVETLWVLQDADLALKKKIARINAKKGFQELKAFFTPPAEVGVEEAKIWGLAVDLAEERNLIAHGSWFVDATGAATVVWHSRFLESEDFVGAELFPDWRFERFMERGQFILEQFAHIRGILDPVLDGEGRAPTGR